MAVYTHFEAYPKFSTAWVPVIGDVYTPSADLLTIVNTDGTLTRAHGGFVVLGGTLLGGVVSALQRTSADGATVYESITGFGLDANAFVAATGQQKFAMVLAGADTLEGNAGADFLKGYGGIDTMTGRAGNDGYYVDDAGDVIVEAPDEGRDIVSTAIATFTLPDNVEELWFSGPGPHTGHGNALDNKFYGAADGTNTFFGLDGNDRFSTEGGGNISHGGKGDDIYYMYLVADLAVEAPDEGYDTVQGEISTYTLPDNIEAMSATGTGGKFGTITGNALDNLIEVFSPGKRTLLGLAGNDTLISSLNGTDTLDGGAGDDRLVAWDGIDTLIGGDGDDTFVIRFGKPIITDFVAGDGTPDRIELKDYKPGSPDKGQTIFTTLSEVLAHTTQNGADTVIDLGAGNSVTLKNVQASSLTANDFVNIGGPGDDTFTIVDDTESLNGDAGVDTMVFDKSLADYAVTDLGGGKIVVSAPGQSFTLRNIEHLQFKDGTVHVNDGDALFDTVYYMTRNPDVFHAGVDALAHYETHGWHEGRDPNPLFDTSGYLAVNKDVAASGANPLEHYRASGWKEGRDPSADFDVTLYLARNPDVAAAGVDPLAHWLEHGYAEGRAAYQAVGSAIVNGFDGQYYLLHNPDVAAAGVDPLAHFNAHGWHEGRNPNGWFDAAGYLAHYSDVAAAGVNPLDHYMQSGWTEGRDASAALRHARLSRRQSGRRGGRRQSARALPQVRHLRGPRGGE